MLYQLFQLQSKRLEGSLYTQLFRGDSYSLSSYTIGIIFPYSLLITSKEVRYKLPVVLTKSSHSDLKP